MTASTEQKSIPSSGSVIARSPNSGVNNSEPQFTIPGPLPEARPATQETLHLTPEKSEVVGPVQQVAATGAVAVPPLAAKSDAAVVSQPQKQS